MFVLCGECGNHYDDAAQRKKCAGIGKGDGNIPSGGSTSHRFFEKRPIDQHISNVQQTRGRGRPNPRMIPQGNPRA